MAKTTAPEVAPEPAMVQCRVLSDCSLGMWGQVVMVEESVAKSAPFLDPHPDAVAAALAAIAEATQVAE